ncbi:MAG: aminotransferase class IV [Bacteroidota bacterium]
MSLLIESIRLQDGQFFNLFYHEQRMLRSLDMLCGVHDGMNLEQFLKGLEVPSKGLYKCRISYDDMTKEVEFIPYQPKKIESLRLVEHDRITYEFKYKDRKAIDRLYELRDGCDDILIVKRGLVTDSSYSNIIFRKGNRWFTPWSALLKGTMRQCLLDEHKIEQEVIRKEDINAFDSFKLINAMFQLDGPEIDVSKIVF